MDTFTIAFIVASAVCLVLQHRELNRLQSQLDTAYRAHMVQQVNLIVMAAGIRAAQEAFTEEQCTLQKETMDYGVSLYLKTLSQSELEYIKNVYSGSLNMD